MSHLLEQAGTTSQDTQELELTIEELLNFDLDALTLITPQSI